MVDLTQNDFIHDLIFKIIRKKYPVGNYPVWDLSRVQPMNTLRQPGKEANEIPVKYDKYFCRAHNYPTYPNDIEDVCNIGLKILIDKELDAVKKVMNPENYPTTHRLQYGHNQYKWNDFKNSDPITDIEKAKQTILMEGGHRPNTLIMSELAYTVLKLHPKIINASLTSLFGIDNILVSSLKISDISNVVNLDLNEYRNQEYVWGNSVVLAYIPEKIGYYTPSFATCFEIKSEELKKDQRQIQQDFSSGRIFRKVIWYEQKITCNLLGFIFINVVDPVIFSRMDGDV